MSTIRCATCGTGICLDDGAERALRQSGATFYCHAGHPNSFTVGPDKRDRKIEGLERQVAWQGEMLDDKLREVEEFRVERRTCPVCGERRRTRRTMLLHLTDAHVEGLRDALGRLYTLQAGVGELAITTTVGGLRETGQLDVIRVIDAVAGTALARNAGPVRS